MQPIGSTIRLRSSLLAVTVDSRMAVKPQPGEITHGTYNSILPEHFYIRATNAATALLRFE
jgi:hypothetical protein